MKNKLNVIPLMLDPLGKHWEQPDRTNIELTDKHAVMNESSFKALHDYSCSMPTGVYNGKMWKDKGEKDWFLKWYGLSHIPDRCSINSRKIIIKD